MVKMLQLRAWHNHFACSRVHHEVAMHVACFCGLRCSAAQDSLAVCCVPKSFLPNLPHRRRVARNLMRWLQNKRHVFQLRVYICPAASNARRLPRLAPALSACALAWSGNRSTKRVPKFSDHRKPWFSRLLGSRFLLLA